MRKLEEEQPRSTGPGFDWHYLKRCHNSPSMKNRKRIWGCVEQIEQKICEYEAGRGGQLLSSYFGKSSCQNMTEQGTRNSELEFTIIFD
jgi:hypothetical protein